MNFPLVSVVVTSFNYADYIALTIESVLSQTYPSIELIVVDDGSTDQSLAVIAGFGDRLRCISRSNCGEAAACNTGFAASRGTIVMFLDSDDMLAPGTVAERLRVATALRSEGSGHTEDAIGADLVAAEEDKPGAAA